MKLIEYRGEVLSGYVPDLPKRTGRCGEMPCLILIPKIQNLENYKTIYILSLDDWSNGQTFWGVLVCHSTPLIGTLNIHNSWTTRPKFDIYESKYFKRLKIVPRVNFLFFITSFYTFCFYLMVLIFPFLKWLSF